MAATWRSTEVEPSLSQPEIEESAGSLKYISAVVSPDELIIAERPLYFDYNGIWMGWHDAVGYVS